MKNQIITLRVTTELKDKLDSLSNRKELSNSELVRPLIEKLCVEEKIIPLGDGRVYRTKKDNSLIKSLEFTDLVFWICDKYINQEAMEIESFYQEMITVISEIIKSDFFSKRMKDLLELIQDELLDHLNNNNLISFNFPEHPILTYDVFKEAMYTIRYNVDEELIIPYKTINDEH